MQNQEKVILSDCPICGNTVRTIDTIKDLEDGAISHDSNEFYRCFVSDDGNRRFLLRKSKRHTYDFSNVI